MLGGEVSDFFSTALMVAGVFGMLLAAASLFRARKVALRERGTAQALEEVIDNLGEGFYRTTLDGKHISANAALVAISGFDTEAELIAAIGKNYGSWYVDSKRRDEFRRILAEQGTVRNFVSEVFRDKTGERIWISENARLVLNPVTKQPSHYEGTVIETTDYMIRVQDEANLRKLTSHVPGGLFQLVRDPKGTFAVVFASSGFRDLLDLKSRSKDFDIDHFVSLIHPEDMDQYYGSLRASRKSGRIWNKDFRVVTDGGKTKWLNVQATPELRADGSVTWHGYLQDITMTKADEAVIRDMAFTDPLTKLPNRRSFVERTEQLIASCQRRNEMAGLLYLDLDNFKELNDGFGHEVGDLLLVEIGNRLKQVVRRSDMVVRLAGDEFVVLLDCLGTTKIEASNKTSVIAQNILASFSTPFHLGSISHVATASIGASIFDGTSRGVDDILRLADLAMYDVKKAGRNAFKLYEQGDELEAASQLNLYNDLVGIEERGELELRFQPQFDRGGRIRGAEALIRWNHPQHGLLTPDKFMPMVEQYGHMDAVNSWVLDTASLVLKDWQMRAETAHLCLAVNVGGQQLDKDYFPGELKALAKLRGIDLSKLTLEFPEKLVAKNRENCVQVLRRLKAAGLRLSLDNFGVDFSSLSLLADMPLDEIKIDGKLVRSMNKRSKDKALIKSILAMADAFGLETVAVHVETQTHERLLMELDCDLFQGFLYSGALAQDDFEMAVSRNLAEQEKPNAATLAA
jgi:diguanylate cyclase (GGDEF)-like protein